MNAEQLMEQVSRSVSLAIVLCALLVALSTLTGLSRRREQARRFALIVRELAALGDRVEREGRRCRLFLELHEARRCRRRGREARLVVDFAGQAAEARIASNRIADAEGMVYESDAAIEEAIQALLERRDAPRMRRDAEEGAGR